MKILITGSRGFVGKNLKDTLSMNKEISILEYTRDDDKTKLSNKLYEADCLVHLAGVNRPSDQKEFEEVNFGLTASIISLLDAHDKDIPIIFSSSTQVLDDNPYGKSKLKAEEALLARQKKQKNNVYLLRLPGIFGQGCKPNYNSVVATFCNNIQRDIPIEIHDPSKVLQLLYVQDLIKHIVNIIEELPEKKNPITLGPLHEISVEDLAFALKELKKGNLSELPIAIGTALGKALRETYQSYVI
jgi:UDP-2-acetamido-2,6-beta-L-arabino-hexul-4-ose reductase